MVQVQEQSMVDIDDVDPMQLDLILLLPEWSHEKRRRECEG